MNQQLGINRTEIKTSIVFILITPKNNPNVHGQENGSTNCDIYILKNSPYNKKFRSTNSCKMDECQKPTEQKKSDPKAKRLYVCIHIKFMNRQN